MKKSSIIILLAIAMGQVAHSAIIELTAHTNDATSASYDHMGTYPDANLDHKVDDAYYDTAYLKGTTPQSGIYTGNISGGPESDATEWVVWAFDAPTGKQITGFDFGTQIYCETTAANSTWTYYYTTEPYAGTSDPTPGANGWTQFAQVGYGDSGTLTTFQNIAFPATDRVYVAFEINRVVNAGGTANWRDDQQQKDSYGFNLEEAGFTINGVGNYTIVVPTDAIPSEVTAAEELQRFIQMVSGETLPIASSATGNGIYAGQYGSLGVDYGQLQPDEIIIKSQGNDLFLSGARPRGSLYAVYEFLEEHVGIRWWTDDVSYIPTLQNIDFPPLDIQYASPFAVREAYYSGVASGAQPFAARSKFNGHFENIPDSFGGHVQTVGWAHTFAQILPPSQYFSQHPDWFALVNGARTASQLNLTNPQMRTQFVANVIQWISDNPGEEIFSVSQNDNYDYCRCPDCEAAVAQLGSQTDLLLDFINFVAEEVAIQHPDVKLQTLAYQWTAPPPQTVGAASNVIIRLALQNDIGKPWDSPENQEHMDYLEGWATNANAIAIWDYAANYSNFLLPHPTLQDTGRNLRIFAGKTSFSVFMQGDNDSGISGDFVQLRAWLLGKLLWNPNLDENELIDEFLEGYYGINAAVHVRSYLDLIAAAGSNATMEITVNEDDTTKWLGFEQIKTAMGFMETALHEAQSSSDPNHAERVSRSKSSIDYAFLTYPGTETNTMMPIVSSYSEVQTVQDFCLETIQRTKDDGIQNYREGMNFSMFEFVLKHRYNLDTPPPAGSIPDFCQGLSPDDYIIVDSDAITGFWLNDVTFRVADALSSTGKALKTPGDHSSWVFQFKLLPGLLEGDTDYRVYISTRCEGSAASGTAFAYGVHDPNAYEDPTQESRSVLYTVGAEGNMGQPYQLYRLGVNKLLSGDTIWTAPVSNADVDWVFVDRFIIVKENAVRHNSGVVIDLTTHTNDATSASYDHPWTYDNDDPGGDDMVDDAYYKNGGVLKNEETSPIYASWGHPTNNNATGDATAWVVWAFDAPVDKLIEEFDFGTQIFCDTTITNSTWTYYYNEGTYANPDINLANWTQFAQVDYADSGTFATFPNITVTATHRLYIAFKIDRLVNGVGTTNWWDDQQQKDSYEFVLADAIFAPLGTPEWWLASFGLTNGTSTEEELLDGDTDGLKAWQEWVSDTDPTDSNSVLQVTGIEPDGAGMKVYWQGGVQATQVLEQRTNLVSGTDWAPVYSNLPPTSVTNSFGDSSATNPAGFYRIKAWR